MVYIIYKSYCLVNCDVKRIVFFKKKKRKNTKYINRNENHKNHRFFLFKFQPCRDVRVRQLYYICTFSFYEEFSDTQKKPPPSICIYNIINNIYIYTDKAIIYLRVCCSIYSAFCGFQGRKRYGRGLSGRQYGVRWIGAQVAKIYWATPRCWWPQVCCTDQRNSVQTLAVRLDWSNPTSTSFSTSSPRSSQSAAHTGKIL